MGLLTKEEAIVWLVDQVHECPHGVVPVAGLDRGSVPATRQAQVRQRVDDAGVPGKNGSILGVPRLESENARHAVLGLAEGSHHQRIKESFVAVHVDGQAVGNLGEGQGGSRLNVPIVILGGHQGEGLEESVVLSHASCGFVAHEVGESPRRPAAGFSLGIGCERLLKGLEQDTVLETHETSAVVLAIGEILEGGNGKLTRGGVGFHKRHLDQCAQDGVVTRQSDLVARFAGQIHES